MRRNTWIGFGVGAALLSVLFGCGGAGGSDLGGGSGGSGGSGGGGSLKEHGTARVDVNTETGAVKVTPLGAPTPSSNQSRSLYTGSAITLTSSSLSTDASELTVKKLKLNVRNNTSDNIENPRLVLDRISTDAFGLLDLRTYSNVSTVVGPGTTTGDGPGPTVTITSPNGIARDTDGSVYIAGFGDGTMRRLKDGYVSRIATGLTAPGGVDVLAGSGFVFAVEQSGNRLVRVPTAGGAKYVLAGSGTVGLTDGSGAAAQFNAPRDMTILDSSAFIADFGNSRIRKVTNLSGASGVVTTLAVSPAIVNPAGIGTMTIDGVDWLAVVSTTTHKLFLVNPVNGQSFQIAGTGVPGSVNGAGNVAQFSSPSDVASVGSSLYVCELNNKIIRQITLNEGGDPKNAANWVVKVLAGGENLSGTADGTGFAARFATPRHLTVDGSGALLVTDINNNRVRKVTSISGIFPVSGSGGANNGSVSAIGVDGYLPASLDYRLPYYELADTLEPSGEALDMAEQEITFTIAPDVKSFYFIVSVIGAPSSTSAALDAVTNTTTPLLGSSNVNVRTIAGQAISGWIDGPSTIARFGNETYVAASDIGYFVSDHLNGSIRFVDLQGTVTSIAGLSGTTGGTFSAGTGASCSFYRPAGLWSNAAGTEVFVTDFEANVVARLSRAPGQAPEIPLNWTVALVAGQIDVAGNTAGQGGSTQFARPIGVTASPDGRTLFVADRNNHCVKQIAFLGTDKNIANHWLSNYYVGSATAISGYGDGVGTGTLFEGPNGVALSTTGDLFISEYSGRRLRRATPSRIVSLVAGSTVSASDWLDGDGNGAKFSTCFGVATDEAGYVYVGDTRLVRRVDIRTGRTTTVAGNSSVEGYQDGLGNNSLVRAISVSYSAEHGLAMAGGTQLRIVERIVRNGAP